MSGEHCSLCHKDAQVFPHQDNAISIPGDDFFPFCCLQTHLLASSTALTKAEYPYPLLLWGRNFLYGFKQVPLSQRISLAQIQVISHFHSL